MRRNKYDLKKNHADKLLQHISIGGNITSYQGYGQENVPGCICCGQNTTKGRKRRKTASFDRVNRSFKWRARQIAKQQIRDI